MAIKARITFFEALLGTASANPEIHKEFVASKSADAEKLEEELASLHADDLAEKSQSVFARTEAGVPHLWDYQIKGFFKDSCGSLARVPGTKSKDLKAYKKVIDGVIFVNPRVIELQIPEGGVITTCQRPLRIQTIPERVCLASSEEAPKGTIIDIEIDCLDPKLDDVVREWLNYGRLRGIGQWRNSGKGRFNWEEISEEGGSKKK